MHLLFKKSVHLRFIIPSLIIILLLFALGQIITASFLANSIRADIDKSIEQSNDIIYRLTESLIKESTGNYLRGTVVQAKELVESFYEDFQNGKYSEEEAKAEVKKYLSGSVIGESGYLYGIDSNGIIVFHPVDSLIGSRVADFDFIRQQIKDKIGGLEYEWKNPDDEKPRKKYLYMDYFTAWDWIISASSYQSEMQSLLSIEDLRKVLLSGDRTDGWYSFITDDKGKFIIHPFYEGEYIENLQRDQALVKIVREYDPATSPKQGVMDYLWQNPGETEAHQKRLFYKWMDSYGWMIGTTVPLDGVYDIIPKAINIEMIIQLFIMAALGFFLFFMSRSITLPLRNLINRYAIDSEFIPHDFQNDRNEITIAGKTIEAYIEKLESEKKKLFDVNKKIRIMAQFSDDNPFPVLRINKNGDCSYINKSAEKDGFREMLNDADQLNENWKDRIFSILRSDLSTECEVRSNLYTVYASSVAGTDEIYLLFVNITNQKNFETLQAVWNSVFQTSIEGISITDSDGRIEQINNGFTRITGYSLSEVLGKKANVLKSDRHPDSFFASMWQSLLNSGSWSGEIWNRRKTGEAYLEWLSISGFKDSRSGLRKYMAIFHDISELKLKEEMLERINYYDVLTDLPNRSLFIQILDHSIKSAVRDNSITVVILLDIDALKYINEELGYPAGDEFLQIFSSRLKKILRDEDTVARLVGDEFAIIMSDFSKEGQYFELIKRIQKTISDEYVIDGVSIKQGFSMGISIFPLDGHTSDEIMRKASTALERTKKMRRGSFSLFDSRIDDFTLRLRAMEGLLNQALEKNEFEVYYQPKISLHEQTVIGFEALLRWHNERKYSPAEFIPLAEDTGMIVPIGNFVIREACGFLNTLKELGQGGVHVGVNISARQFKEPDFETALNDIVSSCEINKELIDLEITESIAASEISEAFKSLEILSGQGYKISIDDFGTGYSSLKYLQDFTFDTMKIDKSFIDKLPDDEKGLHIVKAIISLGKILGKTVVAEGVETEDQLKLLKEEGCDIIQGYYFSKPLPKNDALRFLAGFSENSV